MEIQKRFIAAYDEDIGWCEQLRRELQKEGIGLEEMESVQELAQYSEKTEKKKIEVILVSDMAMAQKICKNVTIPVIFMDGMQDDGRELEAFSIGASDYISKEKKLDICMARIGRYLLRKEPCIRSNTAYPDIYEELEKQKLWIGEKELRLTPKESRLMKLFLEQKGQILTRTDILAENASVRRSKNSRSVDMLITQLRKKLKDTSYQIISIYGKGYILEKRE